MSEVNCTDKTPREINQQIRHLIAQGARDILVRGPQARHNLGVAVLQPVRLVFDGSVGYYCAGMIDGPRVEIRGSTGWGAGESMLAGTVIIEQNAGNSTAASMRGGNRCGPWQCQCPGWHCNEGRVPDYPGELRVYDGFYDAEGHHHRVW